MPYSYIRLQNFRSYDDQTFELSPNVNILVGPNGSGKTNMLEAVYVLSKTNSFRVKDVELIKIGSDIAKLSSLHDSQERSLKLDSREANVKKHLVIEENEKKRITSQHLAPVVLFEPQQLRTFTGPPDLRRAYLDEIGSQVFNDHLITVGKYKRALSQRNRILKTKSNPSEDDMFAWNLQLSELGSKIVKNRIEIIDKIESEITRLYQNLSDTKHKVSVSYVSKLNINNYSTSMLNGLNDRLEVDKERGFTSIGPHREDIEVYLNGRNSAITASRGETRTLLLAFKIAELHILEEFKEQAPILLFDDVFSELDGHRRHMLTDFIKDHQTIITTTDADTVMKGFLEGVNKIPLTN